MFPFDFFRRRAAQSLQKKLEQNPVQEPYINYGKFFYDLADQSKSLIDVGPVMDHLHRDSGINAQSIVSKAIENELAPKGLIMQSGFNKYIKPSSYILNFDGIKASALTLAKNSGADARITITIRSLMLEAYPLLREAIYSPDSRLPTHEGGISDMNSFNP